MLILPLILNCGAQELDISTLISYNRINILCYERFDAMYTLILNPTAGQGAALARLPEIESLLQQRKLEYQVIKAATRADSTLIAKKAAEEHHEGVIAIGGDGSLFAVVNGMAGSDVPLLFVPCGTGNDFVRSLNLPKDPVDALRLQLDTPLNRIDVGRMNDIHFLNISGTGFDVDVLREADRYKGRYKGIVAYLLGLAAAFKNYRPTTAMISIDGCEEKELSFALLSVGNGRYFGGGMKACPDAIVNDGLFDLIIVDPIKRSAIPILLAFYIHGKHVPLGLGKLHRCKSLKIRRKNMTINLDGELLDADSAEFTILPQALCVRIPL